MATLTVLQKIEIKLSLYMVLLCRISSFIYRVYSRTYCLLLSVHVQWAIVFVVYMGCIVFCRTGILYNTVD